MIVSLSDRALPSNRAKIREISEDAIARLVDRFYAKVRADDRLASVFASAIADDAWEPHLLKMRDFWSSVMLATGRYKGNPVAAHGAVAGLEPHLFGRWLELFGEACGELFEPDIADAFCAKAVRIADSLKLALYYRPTNRTVIPGERAHSLAREGDPCLSSAATAHAQSHLPLVAGLSHMNQRAQFLSPISPLRGEPAPDLIGGRTAVARKREAVRVGGLYPRDGHMRLPCPWWRSNRRSAFARRRFGWGGL